MSDVGWLICCIVLDICVIATNICEQILISKKWKYLDRIDHLLLSLSISDLISGLATLGVDSWFLAKEEAGKMNSTIVADNHKVVSSVFDSVFIFSVFASVLHVIAVAIERLYAVRFPRKYYIFTTFSFKCITISAIWIIALILTPTFSVLSIFSLDREIGIFIRGSVLAVISGLVFIIYLTIAYFLLRQRKSIIQDFSPECSIQQDRLKRLTILCLFIGISFVVCTLPITISYFGSNLYHPISNVMITLNAVVNPCIYFGKVYYESRNLTRSRSDTTHALLDTRSCGLSLTNDEGDNNETNSESLQC